MKRLIYTSIARKGLSLDDCAALLQGAALNNRRCGITGVLLLKDETFVQYLEGPKAAVDATLAIIRRDRRHHHFTLLLQDDKAPAQRLFSQWLMGFHHLTSSEHAFGSELLRNHDPSPMTALVQAHFDDLCARLLEAFWGANNSAMACCTMA